MSESLMLWKRLISALEGLCPLISSALTRMSFSCGYDADDFLGLFADFGRFPLVSAVDMNHHQFLRPKCGDQAGSFPALLSRSGVAIGLFDQAIRIIEDLDRIIKSYAVLPEVRLVFRFVPLKYHGCIYIL